MSTPWEDEKTDNPDPQVGHVDAESDRDIAPDDADDGADEDHTGQFGDDPQELQGDDPASGGS